MFDKLMYEGGHEWEKTNLVTKKDKKGLYDHYKCKHCGIEGKSYSVGTIEVPDRYRDKQALCPGALKHKKVKVTRCTAVGEVFANLIPGSIHEIVDSPLNEDRKRGEWVMGVGEPVLLLYGEFTYVD